MKIITAFLACVALLLAGCTTTSGPVITPSRVQASVDAAVGGFVIYELKRAPDSRASFARARSALDDLVANQNWTLSAFAEALLAANVNAISGSDAALYITQGIALVNVLVDGQGIDLKNVAYAKAVITGAATALDRILSTQ